MESEKKDPQKVATRPLTFDELRMEIATHPPAPPPSWPTIAEAKRAPIGQLIAWILWLPPIHDREASPRRELRLYIHKLICFRAQEYRRSEGTWKGEELAVTEEDLENAFNVYTTIRDRFKSRPPGSISEEDKKIILERVSKAGPGPESETPKPASE